MAEDASEKQLQAGQTAEVPTTPKTEQPEKTSDDNAVNEKTGGKSADEEEIKKVAADDSSQDEEMTVVQKLDSQKPKPNGPGDNNDPYAHLSDHEAAVLKRQVETPDVKVGLTTLYRYSSRGDLILLSVGSFCSIAAGALLPLMTILFGGLQGTFAQYFNGSSSYDDFNRSMTRLVLYFVYLAIGMFVMQYIGIWKHQHVLVGEGLDLY